MENSDTPPSSVKSCSNCGHSLSGPFCSHCGQRDFDFKKDWKALAEEYLASMFNLDGKIPKGILTLLFLPGHNTRKFLSGHRASQIPPIRLYLFSSLIFFVFVMGGLRVMHFPSTDEPLQNDDPPSITSDADLDQLLHNNLEDPETFANLFEKWLPRIALFAVPLLALATRFMFWKGNYIYLEHIVIALNLCSFFQIWTLLTEILGYGVDLISMGLGDTVSNILQFWTAIYTIITLKIIFSVSWLKAIGAGLTLAFYSLLMIIFSVFAAYKISVMLL